MKICILGTGTMGSGIAQTFAQNGYDVIMKDISEEMLQKGMSHINKGLDFLIKRENITESDKQQALSHISTTLTYDDIKDCDIVIEAIAEIMSLKKIVFRELDEVCKPETILATNSSSLSITEIAATTKRPEKVIGMHFFNPVPAMKLVEIIKGHLTDEKVHAGVFELTQKIGKTPVTVNEAPGFLVNRLLIPMVNEGIATFADGVATRDEIDEAMKLGAGHPMGPLALADLIGLDVCLAIMEVLHREFGEDKYRPHPLLLKMVRANQLGKKTGIGFYDYRK